MLRNKLITFVLNNLKILLKQSFRPLSLTLVLVTSTCLMNIKLCYERVVLGSRYICLCSHFSLTAFDSQETEFGSCFGWYSFIYYFLLGGNKVFIYLFYNVQGVTLDDTLLSLHSRTLPNTEYGMLMQYLEY